MPDTSASSLLKAFLSSIFGFIPHPTKNLLFIFSILGECLSAFLLAIS